MKVMARAAAATAWVGGNMVMFNRGFYARPVQTAISQKLERGTPHDAGEVLDLGGYPKRRIRLTVRQRIDEEQPEEPVSMEPEPNKRRRHPGDEGHDGSGGEEPST